MEFWGGRLLASLAASGSHPTTSTSSLYSHLHIDHVGWTTDRATGALTFGRRAARDAPRRMGVLDATAGAGGPSDEGHRRTRRARRAGRRRGRRSCRASRSCRRPVTRPGHCSFLVASGTARAVMLGDAIHCPLQISHPEWAFAPDANPDAAKRARERCCASSTRPTRPSSGRTSPTRCSAASSAGARPRQVAFDVAPPVAPQLLAPEAPSGQVVLPPLDEPPEAAS